MAVLEAHNLRKSYGGEEVVAGVRFGIRADAPLHALVLLACAAAGFYAATVLFRRRLLK